MFVKSVVFLYNSNVFSPSLMAAIMAFIDQMTDICGCALEPPRLGKLRQKFFCTSAYWAQYPRLHISGSTKIHLGVDIACVGCWWKQHSTLKIKSHLKKHHLWLSHLLIFLRKKAITGYLISCCLFLQLNFNNDGQKKAFLGFVLYFFLSWVKKTAFVNMFSFLSVAFNETNHVVLSPLQSLQSSILCIQRTIFKPVLCCKLLRRQSAGTDPDGSWWWGRWMENWESFCGCVVCFLKLEGLFEYCMLPDFYPSSPSPRI